MGGGGARAGGCALYPHNEFPNATTAKNLAPEFVLGMLSNIQVNIDEYQAKVLEMEEELRTLKIENNLLRKHVRELTAATSTSTPTPTPT